MRFREILDQISQQQARAFKNAHDQYVQDMLDVVEQIMPDEADASSDELRQISPVMSDDDITEVNSPATKVASQRIDRLDQQKKQAKIQKKQAEIRDLKSKPQPVIKPIKPKKI